MSDRGADFPHDHQSLAQSTQTFYDNEDAMKGMDATIVLDDAKSCSSSTDCRSSIEQVDFNDDFSTFDPANASQTLFHAVASKDYSSLVALYANHSCVSIIQFLQMKRRWTMEKEASHRRHRRKNDRNIDSDDIGAGEFYIPFLLLSMNWFYSGLLSGSIFFCARNIMFKGTNL
jgi:hypothetical protein